MFSDLLKSLVTDLALSATVSGCVLARSQLRPSNVLIKRWSL
jgi:hypothetical protein